MSFNHVLNQIGQYAGGVMFSVHPIVYASNLGWNFFNRTCLRPCNDLPNPHLQQEVQQAAGAWLTRQEIQPSFREQNCLLAQGIQCSPMSELIIRLPDQLRLTDEPVYRYLLKYQFSKLKYSDVVYTHLSGILLTSPGAVMQFLPSKTLQSIGLAASVVGTVASHVFRYYVEYRTEEYAITEATDEELKGALAFYLAFEEATSEGGWMKFLFRYGSCTGGIANIASPSSTSRIKRIVEALRTRKIHVHGEQFNERAPLLAPPDVVIHDLDDPAEKARIPKLKAIFTVLKIGLDS